MSEWADLAMCVLQVNSIAWRTSTIVDGESFGRFAEGDTLRRGRCIAS